MVGADGIFFKYWHPRLAENALPGLNIIALNVYEYVSNTQLVYTWLLSNRGAPMVGADGNFFKYWHPRLPENALPGLKIIFGGYFFEKV